MELGKDTVQGFGSGQDGHGLCRLNKKPPNIFFKKKDKGGINLTCAVSAWLPVLTEPTPSSLCVQVPQSFLELENVRCILAEYRIHNADVTLRCDASLDDLIDVVEGNRQALLRRYTTPILTFSCHTHTSEYTSHVSIS